jgi:hypothetical protein
MTMESSGSANPQQQQGGFADQLKSKTSGALAGQKDRATQGLGSIAEAIRSSGRELGDKNQSALAGYVNNAADSLQRWADTLQRKDVGEIVEDIQRFGRRQPALFIGLAVGAGLVTARFLKSSRGGASQSAYGQDAFPYGGRDSYAAQRTTGLVRDTSFGVPAGRSDLA